MTRLVWLGEELVCIAPTGVLDATTGVSLVTGTITATAFGNQLVYSTDKGVMLPGGLAPLTGVSSLDALEDRVLAVTPTRSLVYQSGTLVATLPGATYGKLDRDGSIVLADPDALARYALDGTKTVLRHGESQPLVRLADGTLATGTELIGRTPLPAGVASQRIAQLDPEHVVTGGFDREIRIAKLGLPKPLAILDAGDAVDDLLARADRVVAVTHGGRVFLWDASKLPEPTPIAELEHPIERIVTNGTATAAWVHGDTFHIVIGGRTIAGWPVGFRGDDLVVNDDGKLSVGDQVIGDASTIQAAAFSKELLATAAAGIVTLRIGAKIVRSFDTHRTDITALAIDQTHVAIGHADGTIEVWTGETKRVFGGHSAHVESMTIRGNRLISSSWDRSTRAWDLETGAGKTLISGQGLAVSPSGQWLATIDQSQLVSIWDATEGRLLEQLPASSSLEAVTFTDDDHVIVGGATGTLEKLSL